MDKVYLPKDIEESLYNWWEESGFFKPTGDGKPFSIVQPPPNVTGVLHLGHALDVTLQDIPVRYKRMKGYKVLWVPGTDHAGIATQNVVEKQLKKDGVSRHELGRAAFLDKVWEWKAQYGGRITDQVRRLGASVDWDHERFTMDDGCQHAVQAHFIKLYNAGLIYRGKYIINWCPRCQTALSDVEVEYQESQGRLWHIRYTAEDGSDIVVATTRPETMFGDSAVAVHPDDKRYAHLIGKMVTIPLANRLIPIIADEYVDAEFGSGAVKITPAHDPNDFEIGQRHDLERIVVMDESAVMTDNVPKQFQGLDRHQCRKQLIIELEDDGFLVKTDEHLNSVGHCYRCDTVVEPYLSNQWFVDMKKLAGPAIDVVKNGDVTITPDRFQKLYFNWMDSIRDWCISRQIWWGHQIPVWYRKDNPDEFIVSIDPPDNADDYVQDEDVLDTWFSSALWPFSTLGWPDNTEDLATFYPNTLLVTGYDILTFWVSRMITMGVFHTGQKPFSTVYIHGLVRAADGKKMSKSLGNAVDPLKMVDEYGADALRYALASLSTLGGQDIKFSEDKVQSSRNFANKIWNVTRYIEMILNDSDVTITVSELPTLLDPMDRWIVSRFYSTLDRMDTAYDQYNFALIAELLWEFIWNDFCDWYIEASKSRKDEALPVLSFVLVNSLALAHPVMPYVTDVIWRHLRSLSSLDLSAQPETLMQYRWPSSRSDLVNVAHEEEIGFVCDVVRQIRHVRKSLNIPLSKTCELIIESDNTDRLKTIAANVEMIQRLSKVATIDTLAVGAEKPDKAASAVVGDVAMFIPLEGLVDLDAERARLQKQKDKLDVEIQQLNGKLNNETFISKAPEAVVAQFREKHALAVSELDLVATHLAQLG